MKKTWALASLVMMAGSLAACGDSGGDGGTDSVTNQGADYCEQVQSLKDDSNDLDFTAMGEDTFDGFRGAVGDIADSAPSDIQDEWSTLGTTLDEFQTILTDAGLTFDDFQALAEDPTNLPEDVDMAKLQEVGTKMGDVVSQGDLQAATESIVTEVKTECDIDLNDSAGPADTPPSS